MVTIEYADCTLIHVLHIVLYELGHNLRYILYILSKLWCKTGQLKRDVNSQLGQ